MFDINSKVQKIQANTCNLPFSHHKKSKKSMDPPQGWPQEFPLKTHGEFLVFDNLLKNDDFFEFAVSFFFNYL